MNDIVNKELVKKTKALLQFVEDNTVALEKDLFLYVTFLEVCKVLSSSVTVMEKKIKIRNCRKR